jgi:hypothetical protein
VRHSGAKVRAKCVLSAQDTPPPFRKANDFTGLVGSFRKKTILARRHSRPSLKNTGGLPAFPPPPSMTLSRFGRVAELA